MNIAIDIYAQRERFGEEKAFEMAKAAGFEYVNYDIAGIEDEPDFVNDHCAYARKIRGYLDKYGLKCKLTHAPYFMKYGQAFDESVVQYVEIVRAIEATAIIGAPTVVVHAITVEPNEDVDFMEYNLEFYRSLIPYCEKFNVKIAIENLCRRDEKCKTIRGKLGTPKEMIEMITKLDSPWFTVCVDVGHAAATGTEPQDYIRKLPKGMLGAVHIHDTDYLGDRHMLPYCSELNWSAIMKALKEVEYDGDLYYEIITFLRHFPDELYPDALNFARKVGEHLVAEFNK